MKIIFYGGVGEVTGANYLVEHEGESILIDCGLAQGGYFAERVNWEKFPYDPKKISAVFVTHAHIDHTGLLPKLVKNGFRGKIYSTPPTKDFANLLLIDSGHILAQAAENLKKQVLYNEKDIEKLMTLWEGVPYHQEIQIGTFKVIFYNAAHIVGSSIVVVEAGGKKIAFSGDLGNSPAPIVGSYEFLEGVDYCVIESTYGNRLHARSPEGVIEDTIEETVKAGGTLMIPAFAMERTQKLLFEIDELVDNGRIPKIPVYLDSPLAIKITEVYKKYTDYFDKKTIHLLKNRQTLFDFPGLIKTLTTEESKKINDVKPPKIIIAGSGMSQGGRIIHHEKKYLPDPKSAIIFIGYQTSGSLGRKIQEGAKTVKIHGEEISVNCRVVSIEEYSAHADQIQLMNWLKPMRLDLEKVFVVQGEKDSSEALALKIINDLAVKAIVPKKGEEFEL